MTEATMAVSQPLVGSKRENTVDAGNLLPILVKKEKEALA